MPRWPDREINAIAGGQRSLVTRAQLKGIGLSASAIDYSVARGRLFVRHQGVYSVAQALPPLARDLAAVLAVGEAAFLSHHSAMSLWGNGPPRSGDVQVIVEARDAGRRRPGIEVHQVAAFGPRETTRRYGIAVTTPARAMLDIAPDLGDHELERRFDSGLKGRLFTRDAVARVAARHPRQPGATRLARLAAAELRVTRITRADTEKRLLALVRAAGLPVPEVNAALGEYVVDFLWRDARVLVETDGYEFHSTKRSFDRDHERDLVLREAGWQVLRFTRDQVVFQPERVLVWLARALAPRSSRANANGGTAG